MAKATVTKPTALGPFTYDGTTHISVSPSTPPSTYTYVGTVSATNAGDYNLYALLTDSTNYKWENSADNATAVRLDWSIAKADRTLSFSSGNDQQNPCLMTYPNPTTFTVTASAGAGELGAISGSGSVEGVDYINLSVEGTTVTAAPCRTTVGFLIGIKIIMAETTNYNECNKCWIASIAPGTITYTATGYSGTYDQNAHGITVSVSAPASGYTVQYGEASDACTDNASPTYTDADTYTVYFTIEADYYTTVSDSRTVSIGQITLTPTLTANDKPYDGTNAATGALTADGILLGDTVTIVPATLTFNGILPNTHTATATGLTLGGAQAGNYTLSATTAADTAEITAISDLAATHISAQINTAASADLNSAVNTVLLAAAPAIPEHTIEYGSGSFGAISASQYQRSATYQDVLGTLNDAFPVTVKVGGTTVATGTLTVTTGHNKVYGTNEVNPSGETYNSVSILTYAHPSRWTQNAATHSSTIEATGSTTVTFKAYLKAGEKLEVATAIGQYHGRVDVTVEKAGSLLAADHIDAFFPVSFGETYTISNMAGKVAGSYNAVRGDYFDEIPEFSAPSAGVYDITMTVTGSSYLLDTIHGKGAIYTGNDPAASPVTTLRSVEIK